MWHGHNKVWKQYYWYQSKLLGIINLWPNAIICEHSLFKGEKFLRPAEFVSPNSVKARKKTQQKIPMLKKTSHFWNYAQSVTQNSFKYAKSVE